jgi:hypothetical protein
MPDVTVSPRRIEQAMAEAMKLRELVGDEDAQLLADTIEGETDVFSLIDRLAERALADKLLVERGKERLKRIEAREDRARAIVQKMMEALGVAKLDRSLATLSVSAGPKSAHVTDSQAVPDVYWRRAIDKTELLRALKAGPVNGAELSNGAPVLRILSR